MLNGTLAIDCRKLSDMPKSGAYNCFTSVNQTDFSVYCDLSVELRFESTERCAGYQISNWGWCATFSDDFVNVKHSLPALYPVCPIAGARTDKVNHWIRRATDVLKSVRWDTVSPAIHLSKRNPTFALDISAVNTAVQYPLWMCRHVFSYLITWLHWHDLLVCPLMLLISSSFVLRKKWHLSDPGGLPPYSEPVER